MENNLKFSTIRKMINAHALNDQSPLPLIVVTYQHSFLYARQGIAVDYQRDWWICCTFALEQEIPNEHTREHWVNQQSLTWWLLPPHINIIGDSR